MFVMYYIYGVSVPSLVIESTDYDIYYVPYPPENKSPPLFDLQVPAQVCLPRL